MSQYHFVHNKLTWSELGSNPIPMASSWQLTATNIPEEFGFIATVM